MKIQQRTKIMRGGAGNSIKTTIPLSVRQLMNVGKGDKIEWSAETDSENVIAYVKKVDCEE